MQPGAMVQQLDVLTFQELRGERRQRCSQKVICRLSSMETYTVYFAVLVLANAALAWRQHIRGKTTEKDESLALPTGEAGRKAAWKFKLTYFAVYVPVMASDWIQGPYMYTLYKDEKRLPESAVAALFTTGFVCAAATATFVGTLADRYGRRAGCLTFCLAYSISCLSVWCDNLVLLFLGRALGGMSTTLLYSVFETWMIAEYHSRDLSDSLPLGDMFSSSVTLSCIVAITSGVLGEAVVNVTETKKAPFLVAVLFLAIATAGMLRFWTENRGDAQASSSDSIHTDIRRLLDKRILALTCTTTIFEGSMYLFVYFWSPSLKSARALSGSSLPLPFGLIFSCFMGAMMIGSTLFSATQLRSEQDTAWLLLIILSLAANALLIPVVAKVEYIAFWSFAVFEMCVGLYYPTMSRLKSDFVDDAVRGKVYGLMRLPLNIFVVLALGVTREGHGHRDMVFTVLGALLLCAFVVVQRCLL